MYKSPIDTLISDVVTEEENAVMRAVVKCDINVDKDELVKALAYDRGQYEKGYADAKAEEKTGEWVKADSQQYFHKHYPASQCSICGWRKNYSGKYNYCPNCGAKMK